MVLPIFLLILCVYFFIIFFVSRLVVPFMGFVQYKVPAQIPQEVGQAIQEIEQSSPDARTYLESAYRYVLARWQATRLGTIRHAPLAFRTDLLNIWLHPGYAHCHHVNYLLHVLLVRSKYFKDEDVRVCHTFMNFFIHQYLQVHVGNAWLDVDALPFLDLPIGKRAPWFG